jgi:hypothetical protein
MIKTFLSGGHCEKLTRALAWLSLTVSLFTTSPAYPWGSKGHEIIAAIAETHLTDAARKRFKSFSHKARR